MMNGHHALDIAHTVVAELDENLTNGVKKYAITGDNLVQVSVAAAQLVGAKRVRDAILKEMS